MFSISNFRAVRFKIAKCMNPFAPLHAATSFIFFLFVVPCCVTHSSVHSHANGVSDVRADFVSNDGDADFVTYTGADFATRAAADFVSDTSADFVSHSGTDFVADFGADVGNRGAHRLPNIGGMISFCIYIHLCGRYQIISLAWAVPDYSHVWVVPDYRVICTVIQLGR